MQKITSIILTKNEETNIERAIKSLAFCDEIIVVDDGSTDMTVEKCQMTNHQSQINSKIQIIKHESNGDFATQRNWAMKQASYEWILFLDADEEVSDELQKEIISSIGAPENDTSSYFLKRRDYFWSQELKYGEILKLRNRGLIRLIKKGSGKWGGKVHEEFIPDRPLVHRVGGPLAYINHYPHPTLKEFISDINVYSGIRAQELHEAHVQAGAFEMVIYPVFKFILNYFVYLGFFDGPQGFVYSFLMSFHSFLVRAKLYQLNTD
ncbi:hypothetical protein COY90_01950 [Candidatus Roizmanbacteria bacterium CG_4_10_14_0_8_um_filter_39_9]|uniref:Glycosyltransferase 2-like domain-containing protein n=1 Tax=Candidatus Roizmanbacteria bacterium CG_4_10_14_0_8_um_filter_39_9 TaxID=1974829 RepID=A0A2M7QEC7_9BACT|nr:MAG: hypothetical protein COY90_01950 [Candidatus Roizmanbacteria bacterium CG_4_10_14_0_8_um_filter_39_9]